MQTPVSRVRSGFYSRLPLLGLLVCLLPVAGATGPKDVSPARAGALLSDRVVAGGPGDFMEVRHLTLKGSNEEIGKALAGIARERYHFQPGASADRLRTRARRRYFEKNYPILHERMRGVAAAFGGRLDDDSRDYSDLGYSSLLAGCSVVFYPPGLTADGQGIVSRNYDFTTGTFRGVRPPPGKLPVTARPYVIELHPDRGYASLAVCSYDLLSGVLDGVNSVGLTVALLADDELSQKYEMEPAGDSGVGLGVQQVLRFLLDTCATVDEAKEALLVSKQYYEGIPCHYLVADRHGQAFVWEYSQAHNREYVIETRDKPLITTNISLHRHLDGTEPPSADKVQTACPRYCSLARRIAQAAAKVTVPFIKENQKAVDATAPLAAPGDRAPGRTLWHALYFPEARKVQVSFYLRDEPAGAPTKSRIVRSDYLEFALGQGK